MGAHVLVVEDSALVVGALRVLLEDAGYRVSTAATVRDALDAAAAAPPDVMLLDLTLPDGDGLAVLERLAAASSAPRVTVAVTGRDEPEVRARCLGGLDSLGIALDDEQNRAAVGRDGRISTTDSPIAVHVVVADEAGEIARDAAALVG